MVGSVRGVELVVLVVLAVAGCRPSGGPPAPTAESAPTASVEAALLLLPDGFVVHRWSCPYRWLAVAQLETPAAANVALDGLCAGARRPSAHFAAARSTFECFMP